MPKALQLRKCPNSWKKINSPKKKMNSIMVRILDIFRTPYLQKLYLE